MSLKFKAVVFSVGGLVVSALAVAVMAYFAMERNAASIDRDETSRAIALASQSLEEIGGRMAGHAALLAINPRVIDVIAKADRAEMEKVFVETLAELRKADPTVSLMEASDVSGKILIRGHNPSRAGDDKSKEPGFMAALRGNLHKSLTISPTSHEASFIAVRPVRAANGDLVGALNIGARLRTDMAEELKRGTGLDVVLMVNGTATAMTFKNRDLKDIAALPALIGTTSAKDAPGEMVSLFGADYLARSLKLNSDNGHALAVMALKDRSTHYRNMKEFVSRFALDLTIMLGLFVPLLVYCVSRVMRRVVTLTNATTKIADGDLEFPVPGTDAKDEIGQLSRAVLVFRQSSQKAQALEIEGSMAQQRNSEQRLAEMRKVADDLEKMIGVVSEALAGNASDLTRTATGLEKLSIQAHAESGTATDAAQQAADDARSVSAASNELSASIAEIGHQIGQASTVTAQAVCEAEGVKAMVTTLNAATTRIGEVVTLISSIAEQTNLLALNATIEAARAGEAGKGFAVVAQEVKQLASQTAKAIGDIDGQINAVQDATLSVSSGILAVSGTIGQMSDIASSIAAAVQQQNAATGEIARSISGAADRSREAELAGSNVAEAVMKVKSEAAMLGTVSAKISERSSELQSRVANVLQTIRAA
ncbi:MAG: methyl-accepting chemotaxis protein [Bosea sp. (in: a-proteobacteria)]